MCFNNKKEISSLLILIKIDSYKKNTPYGKNLPRAFSFALIRAQRVGCSVWVTMVTLNKQLHGKTNKH